MPAHTTRWLLATVTIILGGALLAAAPMPEGDPRIQAQKAILALADNLGAKDVAERAKKIVAEFDSCDISTIFQNRQRKGLGIGKLTELGFPDSVDHLVRQLSHRKTTTEADFENYRADYLRVAKVLQAMAELAPHRGAEFTRNDPQRVANWQRVSAEFKTRTAAFRQAIEQADPKQVRLSVAALQQTCYACHNLRN